MSRTKVFISYSHKDDAWCERLVTQLGVLEKEGLVDVWTDRKLAAGAEWRTELDAQSLSAKIAVLLVSAAFLTSDFVRQKEVPEILERHKQNGMRIYPLLIEPCPWKVVPWLDGRQLRPRDAKPLAIQPSGEAEVALAEVALEIADLTQADS